MNEALRKLAEASLKAEETWHHEADLHGSLACTYGKAGEYYVAQDAAFIAAASPAVVLGLLEERDQWRQAAEQNMLDYQVMYRERDEAIAAVRLLAGALEPFATRSLGLMTAAHYWDAKDAIADEVVRRIVEGG
jgi:hypothetical protein